MPAYQYTLADARNSSAIKKVAGVCSTGDEFRDLVNEAQDRLTNIGDWFETTQVGRFCFQGCEVVFPRWVRTVEGIRLCNNGEVPIHNSWWSIIGPRTCYPGFASYNWGLGTRDSGMSPVYNQVSGNTGKQIAYAITRPEDVGKTITLFGTQYGGQPLSEYRGGVWSEGLTITAIAAGGTALPAMTSVLVTKITSVLREATLGVSYVFEYGPDANGTNALRDLAIYQPTETNPRYRKMRIDGICSELARTDDNGRRIRTLDAICKLQFIPVVNEVDFLLISNFPALKLAIQALRLEDAEDTSGAELKWISAIRELNRELRMDSPSNQISMRVNVSGTGYCLTNAS